MIKAVAVLDKYVSCKGDAFVGYVRMSETVRSPTRSGEGNERRYF